MEENLKNTHTQIIKFVLFEPESTSKPTLAEELAKHYETTWVLEFSRDYLQKKWNKTGQACELSDMLPIAYGQIQLENEALLTANKYLFCDTNLMVTKVFSEAYYNFCEPALSDLIQEHEYDLVFLIDVERPLKKDDLGDNSERKKSFFSVFKQALIDNKKPFIVLSGDKNAQLKKAIAIINELDNAKKMGFSSSDFVQIYRHGISFENIQKQLNIFKNGIPKTILLNPATLSKGILKLSEDEFQQKANFFDTNKTGLKLKKFVPASGAASRMFKFLTTFLNEFDVENESINAYINRKKENKLPIFIIGFKKFPFFDAAKKKLKDEFPDFGLFERDYKFYCFVKILLEPNYFDFANKPKGILPFHKYKTHTATAIEEHMYECAYYSSSNGSSNLHFTVSEAHQIQFENIINSIKDRVENETETTINISYSYQNKATDTIAVDMENKPFRDENGKLVFRPGGHGALIENLNNLDSDIVFIKNIDNVIQNKTKKNSIYKKALAGILMELQQQIFKYLNAIDANEIIQENINEILVFLKESLNIEMTDDFSRFTLENKINKIKEILNRPIRVCGMVKNEGEPGGGPFWVRDEKGVMSLQIVESSQVDLTNENQNKILASATHFNPVDLVCGMKNYKNQKFDLIPFIDHNSGFIVEKYSSGSAIKGYELPGLWNGAMAKWISVFVQVPLITFNPVKTVNDLLKPEHQLK